MNCKKIFLFSLIFNFVGLLVPLQLRAAEEGPVCGSEKPCDQEAKAFSSAILISAVFIGPHFLLDGGPLSKDFMFYGGFGVGDHSGKKLSLDAKSFWTRESQWVLTTSGGVEVFTKEIPARADYSIGIGYKLKPQESWIFIPELNLAIAELIESGEEFKLGPQLKGTALYLKDDKNRIFAEGSLSFFPKVMTRVGLGLTHNFSRTQIPLIPNSRIGFLISYEQDPFLKQRTTFLSIFTGI